MKTIWKKSGIQSWALQTKLCSAISKARHLEENQGIKKHMVIKDGWWSRTLNVLLSSSEWLKSINLFIHLEHLFIIFGNWELLDQWIYFILKIIVIQVFVYKLFFLELFLQTFQFVHLKI